MQSYSLSFGVYMPATRGMGVYCVGGVHLAVRGEGRGEGTCLVMGEGVHGQG